MKELGENMNPRQTNEKCMATAAHQCVAHGEREHDVMAAMLEQYSARLLSMVTDRLEEQLARSDSVESWASAEMERDAVRRKGRGGEKEGEG